MKQPLPSFASRIPKLQLGNAGLYALPSWSLGARKLFPLIFILLAHSASANKPASQCYGTTANGRLDNGWQLPSSGKNFEAYSSLGVLAGRNYVHSKVHQVLLSAYKILETTAPGRFYIYGETGHEKGGRFKPHKTHTNGLSVDFFVPVVDNNNQPTKLSISAFNKLGYNIEFDKGGNYQDLHIDFEAIAKHLLALKKATDEQKIGIAVVIFDNDYQEKLFQTPSGKNLRNQMRFSIKKPWVRHDEHYHVDFEVKCKN